MKPAPEIALPFPYLFAAPFYLAGSLLCAFGAAPAQALGVHPGFTLTSLRPPGFDPMVSGLDFLPDGRLVVSTWEGFGATKGSVYLVANAQSGDSSKVTYKKFAAGLNEPLGVKVLGGEIYLLQKDQLSQLPDKNNDGLADEVKKIASGWTVQPGSKNLEFAMGMVYRDSVFYGGLATAWPWGSQETAERGCIIQMSPKTGGFAPYACGMRTPNGMTLGPDNEIFVTENQGNWVPSSKLLNIRKGRFYGVHKKAPGPFDKEPETPPAIWMDHGNIAVSPTQPVYLKSGVYQGQMLAGDAQFGTLQRYFLEKIGGEYQGAVMYFTGGLQAAANRIVTGPDGALYVGGIGTQEWGGWDWSGKDYGLQRLAPNGKAFFDLLAVRSMGPTSLELEFTAPVGAGADVAANYALKQWFYIPEEAYGAGKQPVQTLAVVSAKPSADKLRVTLEVTGMRVKNVVYLKLGGVKAADGAASWTTEAWYTQNAFGPGVTVATADPIPAGAPAARMQARPLGAGKIGIRVPGTGRFELSIRDASGKIRERRIGMGPMQFTGSAVYQSGLYLLTLEDSHGSCHRKFINP